MIINTLRPPHDAGITYENLLGHLPHLRQEEKEGHERNTMISPGCYPQLYTLVRMLNPRSVLEIGSYWGYSIVTMLQACPQIQRIVSVDAETYGGSYHQFLHENVRSVAQPATKLDFYKKNTANGLPTEIDGETFDLIYVDGDHGFDGALSDMHACWPLVAPGGAMLVDDIHFIQEVSDAVAQFLKDTPIACYLEVLTRGDYEARGGILMFPQ